MRDYFFLKINGKSAKIFFKELQYIEAVDKYVKFVTEKKSYLVCGCLYHVEEWLPIDEFCRVHRSYIVSLRHINEFTNEVIFIADREFPIGKQYRPCFYDKVNVVSAEGNSNSTNKKQQVLVPTSEQNLNGAAHI